MRKEMSKRKLYHIKLKDRKADPEGKLPWLSPPEVQFVSREYARGYIACSQGYYPSPDIRLVDAFTDKLIDEFKGNGEATVNIN